MAIVPFEKLTIIQKNSIPILFQRVGDPTICFYVVDDDTKLITARVPVKLSEYKKLMQED
jgi:hypothetical protein